MTSPKEKRNHLQTRSLEMRELVRRKTTEPAYQICRPIDMGLKDPWNVGECPVYTFVDSKFPDHKAAIFWTKVNHATPGNAVLLDRHNNKILARYFTGPKLEPFFYFNDTETDANILISILTKAQIKYQSLNPSITILEPPFSIIRHLGLDRMSNAAQRLNKFTQ